MMVVDECLRLTGLRFGLGVRMLSRMFGTVGPPPPHVRVRQFNLQMHQGGYSIHTYKNKDKGICIYDAGLPHPPSPPTPWYPPPPPAPPVGWGLWWCLSPPPPVVSLLWWAVPLALFAVVPAAGGTAHDVVLQTATRVDNRIIYDIMLNIIIVVVIFIISTIKEQLPPSPSPYNPHD